MAEEGVDLLVTPQQISSNGRTSGRGTLEKSSPRVRNSSAHSYQRAALGSSYDGTNSGRDSSRKPSSPNNSKEVTPRYLRASTGSCHDFCKFGRKHVFEEEARIPISRRRVQRPSDQPLLRGSPVPLERKKVEMITHLEKHKRSPDSKALFVTPDIVKQKASLTSEKVEGSPKQGLKTKSKITKKFPKSDNMSMKHSPKPQPKATSETSCTLECRMDQNSRNGIINNGKRSATSRNSLMEVQGSTDSLSSSRPFNSKTISSKSKKSVSLKHMSLTEDQNGIEKFATKTPGSRKIPDRTLHVVKTQTVRELKSIQDGDVSASIPISSNEAGELRNVTSETLIKQSISIQDRDAAASNPTPLNESAKSLSPPHAPLSANEEGKLHVKTEGIVSNPSEYPDATASRPTSSDESAKSLQHVNISLSYNAENDLRVFNTETASQIFIPIQNGDIDGSLHSPSHQSPESQLSSCNDDLVVQEEDDTEKEAAGEEEGEEENGYTSNEYGELSEVKEDEEDEEEENKEDEDDEETGEATDEACLNVKGHENCNGSRTLKMGKAIALKESDSSPMKLKFRRGKVVELHSENNIPRRLRFRRGRTLGGNSVCKTDMRRDFKKRVVDGKECTDPNAAKVVLRHQDVQDNKNAPALFNNVIEETANKLVESRKSKVKALVGAFETVISLQDIKPTSDAANSV